MDEDMNTDMDKRRMLQKARQCLCPLFAALIACALCVCAPAHVSAKEDSYALKQSIRIEKQRADEGREKVEKLSDRERTLHRDLAEIEDSLGRLRSRIRAREQKLADVDAMLHKTHEKMQKLKLRHAATGKQLASLLGALWPLRVRAMQGNTTADPEWAVNDRRFTWGGALYTDAEKALTKLEEQNTALKQLLAKQQELHEKAEKNLAAINSGKDDLLAKRIDFVRRIRTVRTKRISEEQTLTQILAAIDNMNYRLKALSGAGIDERKGSLPSPVSGRRFSPREGKGGRLSLGPGRSGISFSTVEGATVNAVFAGRVVHSDILRGYGRVVILSHGDKYYSLYAFLAESNVSPGNTVKEGQTIGWAGTYPAADGPGLYFELRFGQKAINPDEWLTALK